MLKTVLLLTLIATTASPAIAAERTIKVESTFAKKVKGVPCRILAPGIDTTLKTPFRITLPVAADDTVTLTSMTCRANGKTRKTTKIPDARTRSMTVDFVSTKAQFWFHKSNRGVAAYMRDGQVITVR